ncbi:unnamed protein product, partial [marine sediment metagenome]
MAFNPAWPEAVYYNPTTNRIPVSIFSNHFRFALEETETNVFEGIEDAVYHDVATAWTEIELKPVNIPIVPVQMITTIEKREKIRAQVAEAKAAKK